MIAATVSGLGTGVVCLALACSSRGPWGTNYRRIRLPVVLGIAVAAGSTAGAAASWAVSGASVSAVRLSLAAAIVFLAGLVDDLVPHGPRGLRSHLRALGGGHVTTGILKLFVAVAASLVTIAVLPRRAFGVEAAGVAAMAGCANLWNGLDVAPGRATKAFLAVVGPVLLAGAPAGLAPAVPAALPAAFAAAIVALPFDLRERAMLGDGGSNLLGFVAGVGLYLVLPGWGVLVAAAAAVALNVVAEIVTLSRVIEAVPPLLWLDRVGRLRPGLGA